MRGPAFQSNGLIQIPIPSGGSVPPQFSDQPIEISGPERPWIPDGAYQGTLVGHVTSRYRFSQKIELRFSVKVESPERPYVVELGIFFEIAEALPPLGAGGSFKPKGHRSKFAKLLSHCQSTLRTDRPLSMKDLSTLKWQLIVATVTTDWDGNEIPERSRYSVIRSIHPIDQWKLNDW